MNTYFIVGTGTEIGKTYSCLKLLKRELENNKKVSILKPIETGYETFGENYEGSDSYAYSRLLNKEIKDINIYFFKKPMSPHIAGKLDNIEIDINKIREKIDFEIKNNDISFIEGAGGLLVPINQTYFTYLDLIKLYKDKSEVILIINNKLGAINQAMLNIEILKVNGIKISKLIFNNRENIKDETLLKNNIETIVKMSGIEEFEEINFGE